MYANGKKSQFFTISIFAYKCRFHLIKFNSHQNLHVFLKATLYKSATSANFGNFEW